MSLDTNNPHNQSIHESSTTDMQENSFEQSPLDLCKAALADWQDKYARLTADFENYRKRVAKEQSSFALQAQAKVFTDLLSIVDNFDRAMAHQPTAAEVQSWLDGIAMIYASFKDLLSKAGVVEVSYDRFNPELHEALMQVDAPDKESGAIIAVLEKGYMLGDRVLRPAKVSVAK